MIYPRENNSVFLPPYTQTLDEALISSRIPTEMIFDSFTIERVRYILCSHTHILVPPDKRPETFLKLHAKEQHKRIKDFTVNIANILHNVPHFLYNRIDFESQPIGVHQGLFGSGYQHTYWTIVNVIVNETVLPSLLVEAMNDNFYKEIIRLRSVIRHELTHRLQMEATHLNPIKRIQSRRFKTLVTSPTGHNEYYGKPSEILAHANHTVELIMQGHDNGWREVLANYVLTDTSKNHVDTQKYVKLIARLLREYNVPFTKRIAFRKSLMNLAQRMRIRLAELEGEELLTVRNAIARIELYPNGKNGQNGQNGQNGPNGRGYGRNGNLPPPISALPPVSPVPLVYSPPVIRPRPLPSPLLSPPPPPPVPSPFAWNGTLARKRS